MHSKIGAIILGATAIGKFIGIGESIHWYLLLWENQIMLFVCADECWLTSETSTMTWSQLKFELDGSKCEKYPANSVESNFQASKAK